MIHLDLAYLRPDSVAEAVEAYGEAAGNGQKPQYYAGGTEITTLIRGGRLTPGCLIDIKGIPECSALAVERGPLGEEIVLGAAVTLNRVVESGLFPLLSRASEGVADHTVRNRLTLGGNIAGQLPYREALLPLLAADARFVLAGPAGVRTLPAEAAFGSRLKALEGELLLQVRIDRPVASLPSLHRRRERGERVDYPLVSLSLIRDGAAVRMAVSGVYSHPVREAAAERRLGERSSPAEERAEAAIAAIPAAIVEDFRASAEYRRHLFRLTLTEALRTMESGQ